MKILVETSGPFHLTDPSNGNEALFDRPCLMAVTGFISQRLAIGQLKVLLPEVPDEITDADWLKLWDKADTAEGAVKSLQDKIAGAAKAKAKAVADADAEAKAKPEAEAEAKAKG